MITTISRLFLGAIVLASSLITNASFLGDNISISGIPNAGSINTTISQSSTEFYSGGGGGPVINFFCGGTTSGQFVCGFVQTPEPNYFSIDLYENASGKLQADFSLDGSFEAVSLTISNLDSSVSGEFISSITTLDLGFISDFVDPNTLEVITTPSTGQAILTPPIGSPLNTSSTQDSITFELAAGTYRNKVSVIAETTVVPLPAAAYLFASALGYLMCLKRSATNKRSIVTV